MARVNECRKNSRKILVSGVWGQNEIGEQLIMLAEEFWKPKKLPSACFFLLFSVMTKKCETDSSYTLVQNADSTEFKDRADKALNCVYLR